MTLRHAHSLILPLLIAVAAAGKDDGEILSPGAMLATGDSYRNAVATILASERVEERLEALLERGDERSGKARHARILLARVRHPAVFDAFASELQKWRDKENPEHSINRRPGLLSGRLLRFVRRGPESRFVEQKGGWISEVLKGEAGNTLTARRRRYEKVEKYTEAEVQAGVARNVAARQAVQEHFLKFLSEGSVYEQSEIVDLVYRLWGSKSHESRHDEPVADGLLEALYRDEKRPLFVRYTAAVQLPKDRQQGLQSFMLDIVTNSSTANAAKYEAFVSRALRYLERLADAETLAVLKAQSDGPDWKRKSIVKTVQAIEKRLSNPPKTE